MVVWSEEDLPEALKARINAQEKKAIQTPKPTEKVPKKANLTPTERQEQVRLCHWLDLNKIDYFAVPNGSYKSKASAGLFKSEGLKSGVPDMVVFIDEHILFIEMKRTKGSKVSDMQKHWIDIINSYNYSIASICYGCDEAISFIEYCKNLAD